MHECKNQTVFQKNPARTFPLLCQRLAAERGMLPTSAARHGGASHEKKKENHEGTVKLTPDESEHQSPTRRNYNERSQRAGSETGAPMPQLLVGQQLLAELVAHYHSLRRFEGAHATPRRTALSRRRPSREMAGRPGQSCCGGGQFSDRKHGQTQL